MRFFFLPCSNHGTQLNHWVIRLCTPCKLIFKTDRLSYSMMPLNFYKVLLNLQFQICLSLNATRVPIILFPSSAIFFLRKLSFHVVPFLNKFILTLTHSSLSICPFLSPILSSKATHIPIVLPFIGLFNFPLQSFLLDKLYVSFWNQDPSLCLHCYSTLFPFTDLHQTLLAFKLFEFPLTDNFSYQMIPRWYNILKLIIAIYTLCTSLSLSQTL